MALVSPGVQVSVVDESFYTPAEPGTVPVIFCATAQDKTNASGTGTAVGTLAQNAGKPYLLTSQRDLAETFGDPIFKVDANNNPINGSEVNEYGLQAAYSFLGVSNRAWVVRANIDLSSLDARASVPTADPIAGTYWLDTTASLFGIQQWNNATIDINGGQSFTNKVPLVLTSVTQVTGTLVNPGAPLGSIGQIGDYAVVAVNKLNTIWYRNASGAWVQVGSDEWRDSWPTVQGTETGIPTSGDTLTINGTLVTISGSTATMLDVAGDINTALTGVVGYRAAVVNNRIAIYSTGELSGEDSTLAGPIVIAAGTAGATSSLLALGLAVGTYYPPALHIDKHTQVPGNFKITSGSAGRPTGSIWIKTTTPNLGARWRIKLWNDQTRLWEDIDAPTYASADQSILELDRTGGGTNLAIGDLFIHSNVAGDTLPLATFKIYRRSSVGATVIRSGIISSETFATQTYNLTIQSTAPGSLDFSNYSASTISFLTTGDATDSTVIASAITQAGIANVSAEVDANNRVLIKHSKGGEMRLTDGSGAAASLVALGLSPYVDANVGTRYLSYEPGTSGSTTPLVYRASNWELLTYTPSALSPTRTAEDGTLWYNSIVDEVDILVSNGTNWVGYQYDGSGASWIGEASPYYTVVADDKTNPSGPIIAATQPTKQTDGSDLATGDLWIDTSDLENYPVIYRYRELTDRWELIDNGDQTTENGILFADARYGTSGVNGNVKADIVDLLTSTYVDTDAPDPALYPKGMLLFNLRRSGFNVKKFVQNYVDSGARNIRQNDEQMALYNRDRWVTESANQVDGAGSFGRKAQRKVVLQAMQAVVNNNDEIRDDESRVFNLISAPGYPELIGELVTLNYDRGLTGFVVGDSPARLLPNATSLNEWATNVRNSVEDNDDGLVTRDEYLGMFYPWGYTSDNLGNNIVVPPSHMILRTIALSDQVSYPWFAPAGTRRGGITNASATGYISSEGEFVSVALNEGQRDTLYANAVNPITFITGAGLVNFGQKTRARNASSLDRINVARLVIYLRSQLNQLAKPYIFEPNDKITRDEIKQQVESLLLELVGQRALYDFLVVCDETNNTPARIDRNELYVDVAIEPVKSIEFIYIPLRLKNTGEIAGL
tara:strand:+ start:1207 stop:4575 length:3369 start_codon:yes stop_codon:yes gene_type:complete